MASRVDKPKGSFREAAGDLTGTKRLKRKRKADKAKGKVKEPVDKASKEGQEAFDRTVHAGKKTVNRDNM